MKSLFNTNLLIKFSDKEYTLQSNVLLKDALFRVETVAKEKEKSCKCKEDATAKDFSYGYTVYSPEEMARELKRFDSFYDTKNKKHTINVEGFNYRAAQAFRQQVEYEYRHL